MLHFLLNSDPDMPVIPVPATQVHEWLLQNISSTLEHISERVSLKENGSTSASDQDVPMADVCASSVKASASARGPSFIEGISKSSFVKQASDLKGSSVKVNINKQKKDAFQILKPELEVDPETNPHFDARMGTDKNKLLRPKRMNFQFVEEGKWSKDTEIIKLKSQFGEAQAKELKAKQAQLAKAKAKPVINPNLIEVSERVIIKDKPKDPIPETEWW